MILALDPGRDKVGLALVDEEGQQVKLKMLVREEFAEEVFEILKNRDVEAVVLGNGTYSRELMEELKKQLKDLSQENLKLGLVDEKGSTSEARKLYREDNPGSQLKKLLLQVMDWKPAVPLDHYAALVLAKRYLKDGFLERNS